MANLGKVIYINETDYSTLLNGGSITKGGTTYTYDSTALYVIKNVSAPEYAETAGYATNAGHATTASQDGSGNDITNTYSKKPLVIEVDDTDTSVPQGTYNSITAALAAGKDVIVKSTTSGITVNYYRLTFELTSDDEYYFRSDNSGLAITSSDTLSRFASAVNPHFHGNIQSNGTLQTTDITIANGDKLVVTDTSNSNRISRASLAFDGSTTTQALSKKGTWEAFAKDDEGTFVVHFTDDGNGNITKDKTYQQIHNAAFTLKKNVVGHLVVDDSVVKIFNLTDDECETGDCLYFTCIDNTAVTYIVILSNESITKSQFNLATETQLANKANKLKNIVIVKSGTPPNYTYSLPSGTTAELIVIDLTTKGTMVVCTLDGETYYYDRTTGSSTSSVLHFKYVDTTADNVVEKDLAIAYSNNAVTLTTTEYNEKLLPAVPNNHGNIIFSDLPYLNTGTPLSADFPIADAPADAPFVKCFGAITASKTYTSDYIPVSPNDVISGEIWAYRASGATGAAGSFYCGINRYDRNKKPIAANEGANYFVAEAVTIPTNGVWHKYSGTTTIPTTHTAYNGSDGQGVYFVRVRIVVNFNTGTIPTLVGGCRVVNLQPAKEIKIVNCGTNDVNDYANTENVIRAYHFSGSAPHIMPHGSNANTVIDIDGYSGAGNYSHQLGFSSNGNLYQRYRMGGNFGAWNKLITSSDINVSNVVHLDGAETITGIKTFTNGLVLKAISSPSDADRGIPFSAAVDKTNIQFVNTDASKGLTYNPVSGAVKAASFVTRGGTSKQFVLGNGTLGNSNNIGEYVGMSVISDYDCYVNTHPESTNMFILPYIYNDLAYLVERGGNVVVYSTEDTDLTQDTLTVKTVWGSGSTCNNMFNASHNYYGFSNSTAAEMYADGIIIDIEIPYSANYTQRFYIDFGNTTWGFKKIDIFVKYAAYDENYTAVRTGGSIDYSAYRTKFNYTTTNTSGGSVPSFNRMRIHLYEKRSSNAGCRIAQIGLIRFDGSGVRQTLMSRGVDDGVHRNISPSSTNKYDLGTSSNKWKDVYAYAFKTHGGTSSQFVKGDGSLDSVVIPQNLHVKLTSATSGGTTTYSANYTYEQILTSINNGGTPDLEYDAYIYRFDSVVDTLIMFSKIDGTQVGEDNQDKLLEHTFCVESNNTWTKETREIITTASSSNFGLVKLTSSFRSTDDTLAATAHAVKRAYDHGGVQSVNGQTGAVTGLAPVASPALTGTPTAPTAASGTNTTQIATTAFVQNALSNMGAGGSEMVDVTITGTISSASFSANPYNAIKVVVDDGKIAVLNASVAPLSTTDVLIPVYEYTYSQSGTDFTGYKGKIQNGNYEISVDVQSTSSATVSITSVGSSITVDTALSESSTNPVQNRVITAQILENEEIVATALNNLNDRVELKQDQLVSGTTIKTINNQSILGSGNINISGGGGGGGEENVIEVVKVNGTALTPDANKAVNIPLDSTPTTNSGNAVTSGGIKTALDGKATIATFNVTSTTSGGVTTYDWGTTKFSDITNAINNCDDVIIDYDGGAKFHHALTLSDGGTIHSFGQSGGLFGPMISYLLLGEGDNDSIETTLTGRGVANADWNENSSSSDAYIKNKPNLSAVATTGSYWDLIDRPTIPTALSNLTDDSTHRLVTDTEKSTWNGKYSKPSGGIPKTDLASAVQTSLGKADTSLQPDVDNDLEQGTISSSNSQGFDYIIANKDTSSEQTLQDALDAKASISAVNAKYTKPAAGIPDTDLTTAVNVRLLAQLSSGSDDGKIMKYSYSGGGWQAVKPVTIYSGSSAPSSSTGSNGDIYIQTS